MRPAEPVSAMPTKTPLAQSHDHTQAGVPVIGSLFTGYGGLDLATKAAFGGGRIAWVADADRHVRTVLATRTPETPNLGDVAAIPWQHVEPVDVITAGWPCQDISSAGKRAGIDHGTRSGLWRHVATAVRTLRPDLVILENVAALRWRNGGMHRVLADLTEASYDCLWTSLRAADSAPLTAANASSCSDFPITTPPVPSRSLAPAQPNHPPAQPANPAPLATATGSGPVQPTHTASTGASSNPPSDAGKASWHVPPHIRSSRDALAAPCYPPTSSSGSWGSTRAT